MAVPFVFVATVLISKGEARCLDFSFKVNLSWGVLQTSEGVVSGKFYSHCVARRAHRVEHV